MALSPQKKIQIKDTLKYCLKKKFETYKPETEYMPFHYRLLGKDRMALFSFLQSLNTTFGTSIYEPVAKEIAKDNFVKVETQANPYNYIFSEAQNKIQTIMNGIGTATRTPNKEEELEEIRAVCQKGTLTKIKQRKIDVLLEDKKGTLYFMDMKTVKPNIGDFEGYKRMLLTWAGAEMARNPNIRIETIISIPYNPYEPLPYKRWTMQGMFDLPKEILVAEELWNFFGGPGTYSDLLDCFETAGIELRPVIDSFFTRFRK